MDDDDFVRIRVLQSCVHVQTLLFFFLLLQNINYETQLFSVRFERVVVIGIIEYMIRAMFTIHLLYFRVSYGPGGKFSGFYSPYKRVQRYIFRTLKKISGLYQKIAVI